LSSTSPTPAPSLPASWPRNPGARCGSAPPIAHLGRSPGQWCAIADAARPAHRPLTSAVSTLVRGITGTR
jgi:hypothetical protein